MHWSCVLHLGSGYFQGNLKFWQRYAELEKHPVLPWLSPSHPTEPRLQLPGKGHSAPPSHTTIGGREGNTMLQLWKPNTALNLFHKFSNPSWLLTHGAFWNTEPILLPLAQEVPDPLSAGCGEGSPCACPVPVLICPQLIAGHCCRACRQPLQLLLLPSSSSYTLHQYVCTKTDCTYCIICFSSEGKHK